MTNQIFEIDGITTNDPEVVRLRKAVHILQGEVAADRLTPRQANQTLHTLLPKPRTF